MADDNERGSNGRVTVPMLYRMIQELDQRRDERLDRMESRILRALDKHCEESEKRFVKVEDRVEHVDLLNKGWNSINSGLSGIAVLIGSYLGVNK